MLEWKYAITSSHLCRNLIDHSLWYFLVFQVHILHSTLPGQCYSQVFRLNKTLFNKNFAELDLSFAFFLNLKAFVDLLSSQQSHLDQDATDCSAF